jgi:hypothetical protein
MGPKLRLEERPGIGRLTGKGSAAGRVERRIALSGGPQSRLSPHQVLAGPAERREGRGVIVRRPAFEISESEGLEPRSGDGRDGRGLGGSHA